VTTENKKTKIPMPDLSYPRVSMIDGIANNLPPKRNLRGRARVRQTIGSEWAEAYQRGREITDGHLK
jgi:hypothetical protein